MFIFFCFHVLGARDQHAPSRAASPPANAAACGVRAVLAHPGHTLRPANAGAAVLL